METELLKAQVAGLQEKWLFTTKALYVAQRDICRANCIKGPPREHCPACVDASAALAAITVQDEP